MNEPIKEYGYIECGKDDPERTHAWCEACGAWGKFTVDCGSQQVARHWRKSVPPPDAKAWEESEWRLLEPNECGLEGDMFFRDSTGLWEDSMDCVRSAKWHSENRPRFAAHARRKAKPEMPATTAQSGSSWVSVKERLPAERKTVLVDGGIARRIGNAWFTGMEEPMFQRRILWDVTHWMPLPPPPAPEKSAAELAFEEWSNGESCDGESDIKAAFISGYQARQGGRMIAELQQPDLKVLSVFLLSIAVTYFVWRANQRSV